MQCDIDKETHILYISASIVKYNVIFKLMK